MKRFKNILLIFDEKPSGESTLDRAVDLAEKNKARLTVIRVIKKIPPDYQMLIRTFKPGEILQVAIRNYTRELKTYLAEFHPAHKIEIRVVAGEAFIEIIKEVLRNNHDLVIETVPCMGRGIGMFPSSTALHLLRKCPCPVLLLLKPGHQQRFKQVMVATDVTPTQNRAIDTTLMDLFCYIQLQEDE